MFMEALNGHDENFSMQFVNSWENHRVTINGISFHILQEVIAMAISLVMKGRKQKKVTQVTDEKILQHFLVEGEELIWHREGFMREKLPNLWNEVCLILVK